jgi:hypothetical protein
MFAAILFRIANQIAEHLFTDHYALSPLATILGHRFAVGIPPHQVTRQLYLLSAHLWPFADLMTSLRELNHEG